MASNYQATHAIFRSERFDVDGQKEVRKHLDEAIDSVQVLKMFTLSRAKAKADGREYRETIGRDDLVCFSTLDAAGRTAEENREKGWYFVITEDLALSVMSAKTSFFLFSSQDAWSEKFLSYQHINRSFGSVDRKEKVLPLRSEQSVLECNRCAVLRVGDSLGQFLMSLRRGSGFRDQESSEAISVYWKVGPLVTTPFSPVEKLEPKRLAWTSKARWRNEMDSSLRWEPRIVEAPRRRDTNAFMLARYASSSDSGYFVSPS